MSHGDDLTERLRGDDQLERGRLVVICVDPAFEDRIRLRYREHIRRDDQVRIVSAEDRAAIGELDPAEPVLLTHAARRHVDPARLNVLRLHPPLLAPETALEVSRFLVRRRLSTRPLGAVPRSSAGG